MIILKITCWAKVEDPQQYKVLEIWTRQNAVSYSLFDKEIYATGVGNQQMINNFIGMFEGFKEHSIYFQKEGDA